ncbi:MAG: hypothetical protein JSU98_11810 [Gemmatimonadales bacterium]|nr:MAG: hypothetical protein JSU98_11810 [Gemmatimonadales bacterium]
MPRSSTSLIPRLAAEFVVIVVGVLVALGVDSWANDRADRVLEKEYLQRLLDDVRYDLGEFAFLDSIGGIGLEAGLAMSSAEAVRALESSLLVATVLAVANERQPDLSRATYRELLSSGRIDLIRSTDVRVALAEYDRVVSETEGVWENISPRLRVWAASRIPIHIVDRRDEACTPEADVWMYTVPTVCEFDLGGWPAEDLRRDVLTVDAQQRILLSTHRFNVGMAVTRQLRGMGEELAAALERALADLSS